jgi:hypothetical protein
MKAVIRHQRRKVTSGGEEDEKIRYANDSTRTSSNTKRGQVNMTLLRNVITGYCYELSVCYRSLPVDGGGGNSTAVVSLPPFFRRSNGHRPLIRTITTSRQRVALSPQQPHFCRVISTIKDINEMYLRLNETYMMTFYGNHVISSFVLAGVASQKTVFSFRTRFSDFFSKILE